MKIYAPNIHLFAFQLYKGSNIDPKSLKKEDIQLWNSADDVVSTTLQKSLELNRRIIDIKNEPKGLRVELLKASEVIDGDYSISFTGQIPEKNQYQYQQLIIKGFAFPLRIYDSYGLWLNLRRPEKEFDHKTRTKDVDISLLSKLNDQNCLTLIPDQFFLGQTLLITAWLTSEDNQNQTNPYEIAQSCLTAIFPNPKHKPQFYRQGELFGSPIFEYGLFSQIENYQHVIIWLFQDGVADKLLNKSYEKLLDLFFFRCKIVKAFQDSRKIYQTIAEAYDEIEKSIEQIKNITKSENLNTKILNELNNQLKDLSQKSLEYTRLLRNLKDYQNTIDINSHNYGEKLRQISAATQEDNLSILKSFAEQDSTRFDKQINADISYFEQGSDLLEQAIASIRGIVEIEQAKRDRSLEKTIQIVGVGFGGGAIVSGVVTQHIDKPLAPTINFDYPVHPLVSSLFWSVLATIFFGLLAWLFTIWKEKSN